MSNNKSSNAYLYMVGLLFAAHLLAFADRSIFGLVLKPVKAMLHLSDAQAGLLTGAAFSIAYAVFSPVGGYLIDRGPRRLWFAFIVTFWSFATFSTAIASSFFAIVLARAAVGAGESMLQPLAVSLLGDAAAAKSRDRAVGLFFLAASVGLTGVLLFGGLFLKTLEKMPHLALPFVGPIQPWQALFVFLTAPGLVLAALILATLPNLPRQTPARGAALTGGAASKPTVSLWAFLVANSRASFAVLFGYPMLAMSSYSLLGWVFVFFSRVHGWSTAQAGIAFALTSGTAFILGCLFCGKLITALRNRGYVDAALRMCVIGGVAFTFLAAVAVIVPSPVVALVLLALAAFFGFMPSIGGYTAMIDAFPTTIRAQMAGLSVMCVGLVTNSLGAFLVGFLSDNVFHGVTGIRWSLVATMAVSAVVGTAAVGIGMRQFRGLASELARAA